MAELSEENRRLASAFDQELVVGGYSPKTRKMYSSYVEDFLGFYGKPGKKATRGDLISYLAELKEKRGMTNTSLALVHSALKSFYKSYLKMDLIDDIKSPKKEKYLPAVLTKQEVRELIKAAKFGRNRLIVEFLYSSGCRVSEAAKIKLNDLEVREKTARVKGGKGNKDRTIILASAWIKDLKKYLKRKKIESEYVFSKKTTSAPISVDTIQRIIREAGEKAGINKHVTPHALRHSYATHLLESGESIRKIQELLGHESLSTTQIYTRVSTEELKKVKSPLDSL